MLLAQCRRLPMTRVPQVAFLALLIMLAQQSAALTWRLLTLASPQTSQPWQPSAVAVSGQRNPRLELGEVSRLALFGKAIPKAQAKAAVAANAPRTQLNAQLNGVLASSDPAKSIAIIAMSGIQNSYGIGDMIDGTQARIRQVYPDRVIIERDGRDETLMLDGEEYGKPLPQTNAAPIGSLRSELMADPGKITDYLNISPVQVDGRMTGYRLNPGSNPEFFNQSGLQANDLAISINGLDLRDNMQAMQAMQQMAGATEMTVTVERQGEQFDIYVRLSE
ncbi:MULTISPECIES: GspC family type II secretion system variant ExeC [Aeromonas]|uniref:Type II secretion system protein GspC n=1 Tax=Aeromonas veronii TaxID=654 RepID=A0A4S5CPK5_AERVE|nr:GspC family type II secretion system variant ExeC [Aeromonas veronii]THJ46723.1 type II secretion system protein GspC [Aeromonas veronii]TNH68574.1 type II secretion system protein GspC [Aeromonas veronii]